MKAVKQSLLFSIILCLILSTSLSAQTTLSAGDLAFIGINSDGNDDFSFVFFRDIENGTTLNIIDRGWNNGSPGSFLDYSGDYDGLIWTATSSLTAGTIVHIATTLNGVMAPQNLIASKGSISGSILVSYTGDQLFVYQGTEANPTFIAGIHWNVESGSSTSNWDGSAYSNKTSALPDQLTNGVNAIWVYAAGPTERDNFIYNASVTSGSGVSIRAAINNISNWHVDASNTTAYTLDPYSPTSFNVTTPTPVTLTSFSATIDEGSVILNWKTATEINNYGFEIQLAVIGDQLLENEWRVVGFVPGHGNSNSPKSYEFIDETAPAAELEYRLKQIDTDGAFEYYHITAKVDASSVTYVEDNSLPTEFSLKQNYPNPFNPTTKITYSIPINGQVQIIIYDMLGNEIRTLVNEQKQVGIYEVEFDASNLSSGIYFYRILSGNYSESRKMILLR